MRVLSIWMASISRAPGHQFQSDLIVIRRTQHAQAQEHTRTLIAHSTIDFLFIKNQMRVREMQHYWAQRWRQPYKTQKDEERNTEEQKSCSASVRWSWPEPPAPAPPRCQHRRRPSRRMTWSPTRKLKRLQTRLQATRCHHPPFCVHRKHTG